jgi:sulfite oxidase
MNNIELPSWTEFSRRRFLRAGARMSAAAALAYASPLALPRLAWAQEEVVPGKENMIVRSRSYMDLEMPVHMIDSWITPVELFYVRNHLPLPSVNLAQWSLTVSGEVERPLELKLADLDQFEQATITNTLECAGNGRSFYRPRVPGIQWTRGGVGNARYTGARLADVLKRAGVKPTGKHVAFDGLDEPPGKVPDFIRSIPIEKAMHPDTLLATKMNHAPLRIEHGFPLRSISPGWLGAASVKWLIEIKVLDKPFEGNFMKPGYCFPNKPLAPGEDANPADLVGITGLDVKSIIARPGDGSSCKLSPVKVSGAAWAGEANIVGVDVSTDRGRTWLPAALGKESAHWAWRLWDFTFYPKAPGAYVLMSRASDNFGRTQPMVPSWNPSGYLWNAIDQVMIHVEA